LKRLATAKIKRKPKKRLRGFKKMRNYALEKRQRLRKLGY
jgi:hypothetical protein